MIAKIKKYSERKNYIFCIKNKHTVYETKINFIFFLRKESKMKYIKIIFVVLCMQLVLISCCSAEETYEKTDVRQYFGMTYSELMDAMPDLFEAKDTFGTGKTFLTNGGIDFYFEFYYDENILNAKVNRIVISDNDSGNNFIGDKMCIAATYTDEEIYMEEMGFKDICTMGDYRKVWQNDEYVVIVTRGAYAGCCEIDISQNEEELY